MKYWLEGNELVIKKLFTKKRYSFLELTKANFIHGIFLYRGDKCILQETNYHKRAHFTDNDILHLAIKNNLIIEDQKWFEDEISVKDIPDYSRQIQKEIEKEVCGYVKQELGEEYELVISEEATPYDVRLFINIYRNGEKVCINDEKERFYHTVWWNGKKDIHLSWFGLVAPYYINPKTQKFKITKKVDIRSDIEAIKKEIENLKKHGVVPVSRFV